MEETIAPELMGLVFHRDSNLENGFIAGGKQSKEGRQTIFFTRQLFRGEIQMKKHPVMTSQFPGNCTITAVGKHDQDAVYWFKIVPRTRSRISILADEIKCNNRTQSCAGRLHLLCNFSEWSSKTIRKTLNPSTCCEGDT